MAQTSISIPDELKNWVENRVADGSYASSSDYMRDLVRHNQRAEKALMRL
jgi:antitoxin ParD1/3/4